MLIYLTVQPTNHATLKYRLSIILQYYNALWVLFFFRGTPSLNLSERSLLELHRSWRHKYEIWWLDVIPVGKWRDPLFTSIYMFYTYKPNHIDISMLPDRVLGSTWSPSENNQYLMTTQFENSTGSLIACSDEHWSKAIIFRGDTLWKACVKPPMVATQQRTSFPLWSFCLTFTLPKSMCQSRCQNTHWCFIFNIYLWLYMSECVIWICHSQCQNTGQNIWWKLPEYIYIYIYIRRCVRWYARSQSG